MQREEPTCVWQRDKENIVQPMEEAQRDLGPSLSDKRLHVSLFTL